MNIHDGHRTRLKERFLADGLDVFDDHNVLELLLFYAVPRVDVNPLSHRLINKFGSLSEVFDASMEELTSCEGISENIATLIKMVPQYSRRYLLSKNKRGTHIVDADAAARFMRPLFIGATCEYVYALFMDSACCVVDWRELGRGDACGADLSARTLLEAMLSTGATSVVLAHNHPGGLTKPTDADLSSTKKLRDALESIDAVLLDHIIFVEGRYISVSDYMKNPSVIESQTDEQ